MTLAGESIAPNSSTLDGRRDIQVIRLRGEKPGDYEVRFVYRRPFEPDAAPVRTVTHRIEVRRGP
jgi:predicted secreted protein